MTEHTFKPATPDGFRLQRWANLGAWHDCRIVWHGSHRDAKEGVKVYGADIVRVGSKPVCYTAANESALVAKLVDAGETL